MNISSRSLRVLCGQTLLFSAVVLFADGTYAAPRSFDASRTGRNGGSVEVQGQGAGRYRSGSVSAEGPNGGTYDASGTRVGRFSTGSASAQGPNGGTYNASGARAGRYSTGSVNAQGARGASYSATTSQWHGYRSGYVYSGGAYHQATVVVNKTYVAPVGVYAGWNVIARPVYVAYPQFATYPVEVAVQAQLKQLGYYGGTVDGQLGPKTANAIAKYQAAQGLAVTGTITQALLKSLGIV